jgi:hypothetical protein
MDPEQAGKCLGGRSRVMIQRLSWHVPGGTEEDQKPVSRQPIARPGFKPRDLSNTSQRSRLCY